MFVWWNSQGEIAKRWSLRLSNIVPKPMLCAGLCQAAPETTHVPTYEIGTYWISERGQTSLIYVSDIVEIDQISCYELTTVGSESIKWYVSTENLEIISISQESQTQNIEIRMKLLDFPLYVGKSWASEWQYAGKTFAVTANVTGIEKINYCGTNEAYKIEYRISDSTTPKICHYIPQNGDFSGSCIIDVYEEGESGRLPQHVIYGKTTVPLPDTNANNISDILEEFEASVRAIEEYNKAIKLNPNLAGAYNNRGFAYHNLKEYEKAIKDYNKAIELNPNLTDAYNNRGVAYYNLEEYEKAIKDYNKAIELDPNLPLVYDNIGLARSKSKKVRGFEAVFVIAGLLVVAYLLRSKK